MRREKESVFDKSWMPWYIIKIIWWFWLNMTLRSNQLKYSFVTQHPYKMNKNLITYTVVDRDSNTFETMHLTFEAWYLNVWI